MKSVIVPPRGNCRRSGPSGRHPRSLRWFHRPRAGTEGVTPKRSEALQKETTITVWRWAPQLEPIVKAFEEKYPKVNVNLENVGTGNDHYTKLQNAIKAGSGAPDVAQIEYSALPQFALSDSLVDLTASEPVNWRISTPPRRGARSNQRRHLRASAGLRPHGDVLPCRHL